MPLKVFASPDFLKEHPSIRTLDGVMRHARISPDDSWWLVWRDRVGGEPSPEAPRGIRLDTQIAEGQAAMAGLGIALLNPILWSTEIASGRLVAVLDDIAYDPSDFWLVYPEHHRHAAKIRLFRDWLLDTVAREATGGPPDFYAKPGGLDAAARAA
jgi:LysR family glycine cleavage system transcriptional activator